MNFDKSIKALAPGDRNFLKLAFFKNWFLPELDGYPIAPNKQNMPHAVEAIMAHRLLETARNVYANQPSGAEISKSPSGVTNLLQALHTHHEPKTHEAVAAFRHGVSCEGLPLPFHLLTHLNQATEADEFRE